MRPRLLDLFCKAGGAAMGYAEAGFEVVGVDIEPQPNYPFEFFQANALTILEDLLDFNERLERRWRYPLGHIAAVHASPPCQAFTAYRRKGHGVGDGYADLIAKTRDALRETGLPYVIENVLGAPLENPTQLCGSSFGLDVRRHRLFETNWPLMGVPCCHGWQTPRFPAATNRKPMSRCTVEIGVYRIPLETQKRAMGVDWDVTLDELSNAVPPKYTEHIGARLMEHLAVREELAA